MKKLGICVCYNHKNYGSQLQSYATTVELERRGIDYEIIRYKKKLSPALLLRLASKIFNPVFLNDRIIEGLQKKIMLKLHSKAAKQNAVRDRALEEFSSARFTRLSPVYNGFKELEEGAKRYDGVLVGSDQLWSPGGFVSNLHNFAFCQDDCIKMSYAASFGVSSIKERYAEMYSFLDKMDYISVREDTGADIVKKLSGRNAELVVDPVLLLDEKQWLKEIEDRRIIDEPYVFAYFLGKSADYRYEVKRFSRENGYKIVSLPHMDSYNKSDEDFGDITPYDIGPEEFVNLIRHAEHIFTDSFHGMVFSVIHKKSFMIFNRYPSDSAVSKNSRIESFCYGCGLQRRRYNGEINAVKKPIEYYRVYKALDENIENSRAFLNRALKAFER